MTSPAFASIIAVGLGAALGGLLRWGLVEWLNPRSTLPLGTLASNLIGGFLVGVAVAALDRADVSPAWRLFIITGFLGGLTTFSTFSAESVGLLMRGSYGWAMAHAGTHLLGSLALTALGIATYRALA
jgi:fluoride exporter